jgi:hypothetical protein
MEDTQQDWIASVYDGLAKMDVILDNDPLEFGPDRLNQKTAEVRNLLSKVEKLFIDLSQKHHLLKRELLAKNTEFTISKSRLMVEDPHVRAGRDKTERDVLAEVRLTDLLRVIKTLEMSVSDLDEILKVVKAKRTDLKDIQGRLKDQLKLCQEELGLGRRWGKTHDAIVKVIPEFSDEYSLAQTPAPVPKIDDSMLDAVLNRIDVKAPPAPIKNDSDIEKFFNTDIKTETVIAELNLDDLWDDQ